MNYDVIQPNSELKAYARRQLNGVWNGMAFTYFIYFLICLPQYIFSFLDSILDPDKDYFYFFQKLIYEYLPDIARSIYRPDKELLIPVISNVLAIIMLLAAGPFALGFAGFFLRRIRGEQIAVENIFDGFKRFFPGFLAWLFTTLFTILWSLLLVIPGIVKAFGYSMTFYIMYDNPNMEPLEALKKSQIMMKGYKMKLFWLEFSFIGWMFLAYLTFGIGFLWLNPYMYLSIANFYENLKRNQENNQTANPITNQNKPPIDLFQVS